MIPSVAQCFALMEEYRMLDNIRSHSLMVARVAGLLAGGLRAAARAVSEELVVAGALLHDIAKTGSLGSDADHARLGAEICRQQGYAELADIVAQHVVLQDGVPESPAEREIVYYADKRVLHVQVVSLVERLDYILARYGGGDARLCRRIEENFSICRAVEAKLFSALPYGPDEVAGLTDGRPFVFEGVSL